MDERAFAEDAKTQKAVLADFAIIGEAAAHIPEEVLRLYPSVPWRSMRGMRNVVIHSYFHVEYAIVWETIQTDLPSLVAGVRSILAAES